MGYELHITRAESWSENAGAEITADEWLTVVRLDPELEIDTTQGPYFARWSGQSRYPDPWLDGHPVTSTPRTRTAPCCARWWRSRHSSMPTCRGTKGSPTMAASRSIRITRTLSAASRLRRIRVPVAAAAGG